MRVTSPLFAVFMIGMMGALPGVARAGSLAGFADCPVAVAAKHGPMPRLTFTDAQARHYSSVIREAARGPVNFAGHYILATWGCGSGCVMAAAIDAQTGRVTSLPFTVSDWPTDVTEPLAYRADSCVLIVHGSRNERAEHGTYHYAFDGKAFSLRKTASEFKRWPAHATTQREAPA